MISATITETPVVDQSAGMRWTGLPQSFLRSLAGRKNIVLLESSRPDATEHRSLLFADPVAVLEISTPDEVPTLFAQIEQYLHDGFYVAGYLAYECGHHFVPVDAGPLPTYPLAVLGVYREPLVVDHLNGEFSRADHATVQPSNATEGSEISELRPDIREEDYRSAVDAIHRHIHEGNTYQINFTTCYRFNASADPVSLYAMLRRRQRVSYGAYIATARNQILSFSPELFFRRTGDAIVTRPMKGTAPRGRTTREDRDRVAWLAADEKNRAENVMIVDLLRNDLGRICTTGSVAVRDMFHVETYRTVHQMTSTVTGTLRRGISHYEIFASLFPSGSVTGAPKIRSMQIINALEPHSRGVYTGAIGYFAPSGDAVFSVAIRTIVLEGGKGSMGVGSGIVAASEAGTEYNECVLKGKFLSASLPSFQLFETLLWEGGFPFLEMHLDRMLQSAEYFDIHAERKALRTTLLDLASGFAPGSRQKVRLTLDEQGTAGVSFEPLETSPDAALRVCVSSKRTNPDDPFFYHKTTHRPLYGEEFRAAQEQGCADVLFLNTRGELTEGAISNIFMRKGNLWFTPPVECGLLEGVYRRHLLETQSDITVRILTLRDLYDADEVFLCNAVRGLRRVEVTEQK